MVDARLFQALSDSTRLNILALLARGTINVSGMVTQLGCAQPAVSRHLRVLREASLITDRRKGKEVEYSLRPEALTAAAEHLEELARAGAVGLAGRGEVRGQARGEALGEVREGARGLARDVVGKVARQTVRRTARAARAATAADKATDKTAPETRTPARPARDFAGREAEFVIKPKKKSGLDDFLL